MDLLALTVATVVVGGVSLVVNTATLLRAPRARRTVGTGPAGLATLLSVGMGVTGLLVILAAHSGAGSPTVQTFLTAVAAVFIVAALLSGFFALERTRVTGSPGAHADAPEL